MSPSEIRAALEEEVERAGLGTAATDIDQLVSGRIMPLRGVRSSRALPLAAVAASVICLLVVGALITDISGRPASRGVSTGEGSAQYPNLADKYLGLIQVDSTTASSSSQSGSGQEAVDPESILSYLEQQQPAGTLGGSWWSSEGRDRPYLVVESTSDREGRSQLQEEADQEFPGLVQIVAGRYSMNEYETFKKDVFSILDRMEVQNAGVGLGTEDGRLDREARTVMVVSVDSDDLSDFLVEQVLSVVPEDALKIAVSG